VLKDGFIEKLVEKPQELISNLALVGLYYFVNPASLRKALDQLIEKDIRTRGELQLTDAIQLMIQDGEKITTFPVEGWYDCGKPETILSTNKILLDKNGSVKEFKNVVINRPVYIAEDVDIRNSVIGPYTTIDRGTIIESCIIKNSIIGRNSKVSQAVLKDSLIGDNTIIRGVIKNLTQETQQKLIFIKYTEVD